MNQSEYIFINYFLPFLGLIITALAQFYVTRSYNKYKEKKITTNKTGFDVAREILDSNNLKNIKILETSGTLTDHYDPSKKVIKLSKDIYEGNTIAAVSVAAHECGHALQDKYSYGPLKFRAFLVPHVNFSTKIGYLAVVLGIIFNAIGLAKIGLILLLTILLFQLVTLPVEFNASSRAKEQLQKLKVLNNKEQKGSKTMLTAAALTYVASVLSTMLQILRLALIVRSHDD